MSKTEVAAVEPKSLAKGLVAGLIAGLVGVAAKTLAERMFPPHAHSQPDAEDLAAEKLAGDSLSPAGKALPADGIHWAFGAAAGAAYGALAEYYPAATAKEGAAFGMALETLTQEGALPALGLAAEPADQTLRERASEVTSHVVFGVTTEWVRSLLRRWL
jgi:putative membrane protein